MLSPSARYSHCTFLATRLYSFWARGFIFCPCVSDTSAAHLICARNGRPLSPVPLGDPFPHASAAVEVFAFPATQRTYPDSAPSHCAFRAIRLYFLRVRGFVFCPLRNYLQPKRTASVSRAFGKVLPFIGFGREALASGVPRKAKFLLCCSVFWVLHGNAAFFCPCVSSGRHCPPYLRPEWAALAYPAFMPSLSARLPAGLFRLS